MLTPKQRFISKNADDKGILNVASDFYAGLFSRTNANQRDVNEFIEHVTLPVLTQEKQRVCEGDISEQECVNAIKKMKSNKFLVQTSCL